MSETTPLIKAALNLRVGAGFDVYHMNYFPNALTEYLQELRRQMRIWNLVKDAMLCVI